MTDTDEPMLADAAIDRIWDLARSIDICMFITWDGHAQRARPLHARPNRDEGRIYFLVDAAGHEDEQIERFPIVTLAFSDIRADEYVAITGRATVSADRARIRQIWTASDAAWWESADDPSIRLLTVEPGDAELWNGAHRLISGAEMRAAADPGARLDFGENIKVDQI